MMKAASDKYFGMKRGVADSLKNTRPSFSRLYDANTENLKKAINYLTHLKSIGMLSNKEFSYLVTKVCASFVENEITIMLDKVLNKALKEIFED